MAAKYALYIGKKEIENVKICDKFHLDARCMGWARHQLAIPRRIRAFKKKTPILVNQWRQD